MRFALDASQLDFAASLDSMLGAADVPTVSRALASGDVLPCRNLWSSLAQLGVTSLLIDPEFDGLGADPVDMVVALERLGKWAVPGPVVESIVAVPALLGALPSEQQREWLPGLASGQLISTLAMEPHVPYAVDPAMADVVLLARTASVSTASVSTATVIAVHESIDPSRRLGEVVAEGTQIAGGDSTEAIDRAEVLATLACAAQLLGAGQAMLDATVDYAKSRQ
ncbi:MAG: acyl-CoA dehydrogenase family protein, partial [Rhodococcus sp. (in: high G+C Gram-positive bacteria)]